MTVIPKSIALVIGSIRNPRVGPEVAKFIASRLEAETNLPDGGTTVELVDIASFNLPVFDEAVFPKMVPEQASFAHQHSKTWSATMSRFDAFIFLTPEYNAGIPGGLKNALDYLYNELHGKPVAIMSYGGKGGDRAAAALETVLDRGIGMKVVETKVALPFQMGKKVNADGEVDEEGEGVPEIFGAVQQGALGPESKRVWEKEYGGMISKVFGELKEMVAAA